MKESKDLSMALSLIVALDDALHALESEEAVTVQNGAFNLIGSARDALDLVDELLIQAASRADLRKSKRPEPILVTKVKKAGYSHVS